MIAATVTLQETGNRRTQTVGGCADSIFVPRAESVAQPPETGAESRQSQPVAGGSGVLAERDLIEQAHADYWTI